MSAGASTGMTSDRGLLPTVRTWAEMIKFSHTVFALPFALLATFLAARSRTPPALPGGLEFALILVCMIAARSAAMTFNRIADAAFDAANPRTANRAIPRGSISIPTAWGFVALSCAVFLAGCAAFWLLGSNPWPLLLSAPTLAALAGYSYTKRFTRWSHLVLGAVIAFAPVAAWIAIHPTTLGPAAWLLMLAVATWIAGFDIIYACQDVAFDRRSGLHSLPAALSIGPALWLSRGLHVVTVAALVGVGAAAGLGPLYYSGVAITAALLVYEQSLVRTGDLSRVNLAFFTVNGLVGVGLGGLGVADVVVQVARA